MVGLEIGGDRLEIGAETTNHNHLTLTVRMSDVGGDDFPIGLEAPFRRALSRDRLARVVESLLAHDYLLLKKLQKGGALVFDIPAMPSARIERLEAIVSLNQEAAVSAKPNEKVLPWLLPRADTAELYPFQRDGVEWLLSSSNRLLADDMGLGKTVQTIFGVRHGFSEKLFKNVLVLCPKSLVLNWLSEFRKWAPELVSLALSPPAKSVVEVWNKALDTSHVVIANYEQLREAKSLAEMRVFDLVVADEAHRLRNATSQVVQGFRFLKRDRFWALTGTPIERDLKDLATLLSLLDEKRFSVADARTAGAALRKGRGHISFGGRRLRY